MSNKINGEFMSTILAVMHDRVPAQYKMRLSDDFDFLREVLSSAGIEYRVDADEPGILKMYPA